MKLLLLYSFLFIQLLGYASPMGESFVLRNDTIIPGIDKQGFGYRGEFPSYPGGEYQMLKDVYANLVYPEGEKSNGIQGVVHVQFYVEKDGSVTGAQTIQGITNGENLNIAAEEAVMKLKKFVPVKKNGNPEVFQMTLPVRFKLPEEPIVQPKK